MSATEQFQLFPHGFVYVALIFMLGWVAFMASLALRALSRRSVHRGFVHKVDRLRYSNVRLQRDAQPVDGDTATDEARVGGVDR